MLPAEKLGPAATALREQARARGRAEPEIVVRRGLKLDDAGAARARLEAARAQRTDHQRAAVRAFSARRAS
jgi:hypothetical protein